jgi:RNase P protein component
MRESVRGFSDRICGGWDCLFIARRGSESATLDQIDKAIGQLLVRAQILGETE